MLAGMAEVIDPRLGLKTWTADSDQWPGRVGWNAELTAIFTKTTVFGHGPSASRPSTLIGGRLYWATDSKRMFYDDGTQWTEISPVGDGTVGKPSFGAAPFGSWAGPGVAGTAGSSRIAARVDHTHPQPAWPVNTWRFRMKDDTAPGAGAERPVFSAAIPSAPSGLYLLGVTAICGTQDVSAAAFTQNYLQLNANGVSLGRFRADCDRKMSTVSFTVPFQWDGGALALQLRTSPYTATVLFLGTDTAGAGLGGGTSIWASFLGPAS